MKITIEVDCTPEEARDFFGLPRMAPMQEALAAEIQNRLMDAVAVMGPESLLKTWLPTGLEGWEQVQKAFWAQAWGTEKSRGYCRTPGQRKTPRQRKTPGHGKTQGTEKTRSK